MRAADDQTESLDARLLRAAPGDWPNRKLVDLDIVGDPGAWLSEVFGEPVGEVLFGWARDDHDNACSMAADYLSEIRKQGYPVPSDFGDDPNSQGWTDEVEQSIQREFLAFVRCWRKRALQELCRETESDR
jgi:hypothetical protein